MDFNKFGKIIGIIGVLIFIYGIIQFAVNQPKQFDPSESKQTILGRDDLGNMLEVHTVNMIRERKRDEATTIIIIGGIISVIGFGMWYSSKKTKSNTMHILNKDTIFCSNCGKKYSSEHVGAYCEDCGNRL